MKKLLLMAAIVAAGLSSCSKNEITLMDISSDSNTVKFGTYNSNSTSTKGQEMTQTYMASTGFGVLAYKQGSGKVFSDAITPNFMYNEKVYSSDNGTNWTYDVTKYWDEDETNVYSFFAYAPYDGNNNYPDNTSNTDNGIELSANSESGTPTAKITLPENPTKMVDFVTGQSMNIDKFGSVYSTNDVKSTDSGATSAQGVSLNLKHQTTRVEFKVKCAIKNSSDEVDTETYINIKRFKILGTDPLLEEDVVTVQETYTQTSNENDDYLDCYKSMSLFNYGVYTFATTTTNDSNIDHDDAHLASNGEQDGTWDLSTFVIKTGFLDNYGKYDLADICKMEDPTVTGTKFYDSGYAKTGVPIQGGSDATTIFAEAADGCPGYLFLLPPNVYTGLERKESTTALTAYNIDGTKFDESSQDADKVYGIDATSKNIQIEIYYDVLTVDPALPDGHVVTSADNYAILDLNDETLKQGHAYLYIISITGKTSIKDPTTQVPDEETQSDFDAVTISAQIVDWDETEETAYSELKN